MSRWGGQSCPQPAFSRPDPLESGSLEFGHSALFVWGRLVICGRLVIGPYRNLSKQQADYQSAAGYHPAPHKNVQSP
jgi:hypothetical protein